MADDERLADAAQGAPAGAAAPTEPELSEAAGAARSAMRASTMLQMGA